MARMQRSWTAPGPVHEERVEDVGQEGLCRKRMEGSTGGKGVPEFERGGQDVERGAQGRGDRGLITFQWMPLQGVCDGATPQDAIRARCRPPTAHDTGVVHPRGTPVPRNVERRR